MRPRQGNLIGDCQETCLYCGQVLAKRHEHDHFPIPKRHGGADTYCVCINCHERKDRTPLDDWGTHAVATMADLWPRMTADQRILLGKIYALVADALYQLKTAGWRREPNTIERWGDDPGGAP